MHVKVRDIRAKKTLYYGVSDFTNWAIPGLRGKDNSHNGSSVPIVKYLLYGTHRCISSGYTHNGGVVGISDQGLANVRRSR